MERRREPAGGFLLPRSSALPHVQLEATVWKVRVAAFILVRMPAAIKQIVTVRPGGVVEVRSPELREGDRAEVTVVVVHPANIQESSNGAGRWRRYAGAFNSGNPSAGDNDRIDADLAREYGNGAGAES